MGCCGGSKQSLAVERVGFKGVFKVKSKNGLPLRIKKNPRGFTKATKPSNNLDKRS
tara:strand:+ start:1400 stop:1567 length:168 start_codon:yes stop_codon:yes gene_type:complete